MKQQTSEDFSQKEGEKSTNSHSIITVLIKYSSYTAGSSEMPVHFYLTAQCHILCDSNIYILICVMYKNIAYHIKKKVSIFIMVLQFVK